MPPKKTMTEKEKLESYIKDGFKTHMIIRDICDEEKKSRLPEVYWDKEVFGLPLWREDNQKRMFYFIENETKKYAQDLVKAGKEVIGYHPVVYVSVISNESIHGRKVHFESVIDSFKEVKRWDVRPSSYPNVIEIHFDINSGDKHKVENAIEEVGKILYLLTLKNKKGFHIASYSSGERYCHQPFSANAGLVETMLEGFSAKELEKHYKLLKNDNFVEVVNALRLIYSQVNNISKITVSWATIEDIFGHAKPTHILEQKEIKKVVESIRNLEIDERKKKVLVNRIKDSSLFSKKSRNERIAENISSLLEKELDVIKKQLKNVSKLRGKLVHSINMDDSDVKPHLQFIESIFLKYLKKLKA